MTEKKQKWGNSQGIRFPKAVLQEAGVAVNDTLTVKVEKGRSVRLSRPGGRNRSGKDGRALCEQEMKIPWKRLTF